MSYPDIDFLNDLEQIVRKRLDDRTADSYTVRLAEAGNKRIAQKVGEEGVELALAAATENREEIIDEAADLIYHMIVLLANQGLSITDVTARLQTRHSPC